jgi:hypothetical protein
LLDVCVVVTAPEQIAEPRLQRRVEAPRLRFAFEDGECAFVHADDG